MLHRPDLVETLEASGTELQHAVQKILSGAQDSDGMCRPSSKAQ